MAGIGTEAPVVLARAPEAVEEKVVEALREPEAGCRRRILHIYGEV